MIATRTRASGGGVGPGVEGADVGQVPLARRERVVGREREPPPACRAARRRRRRARRASAAGRRVSTVSAPSARSSRETTRAPASREPCGDGRGRRAALEPDGDAGCLRAARGREQRDERRRLSRARLIADDVEHGREARGEAAGPARSARGRSPARGRACAANAPCASTVARPTSRQTAPVEPLDGDRRARQRRASPCRAAPCGIRRRGEPDERRDGDAHRRTADGPADEAVVARRERLHGDREPPAFARLEHAGRRPGRRPDALLERHAGRDPAPSPASRARAAVDDGLASGSSESTPTGNQVERRPSRVRTSVAADARLRRAARPPRASPRDRRRSASCAGRRAARARRAPCGACAAVKATGPQRWCGEAESYGIGDRDEVRDRRPAPHVGDVRGAPAGGREEERRGHLARRTGPPGRRSRRRPRSWSAPRRRCRRRPGCARRRRGRTARTSAHGERVRARDDGLRLQRLGRPRRAAPRPGRRRRGTPRARRR